MKEEKDKSSLQALLEKNAAPEGLTKKERDLILELFSNPVPSEKNCWLCEMHADSESENPKVVSMGIYDTNLCLNHAFYAYVTRK